MTRPQTPLTSDPAFVERVRRWVIVVVTVRNCSIGDDSGDDDNLLHDSHMCRVREILERDSKVWELKEAIKKDVCKEDGM